MAEACHDFATLALGPLRGHYWTADSFSQTNRGLRPLQGANGDLGGYGCRGPNQSNSSSAAARADSLYEAGVRAGELVTDAAELTRWRAIVRSLRLRAGAVTARR